MVASKVVVQWAAATREVEVAGGEAAAETQLEVWVEAATAEVWVVMEAQSVGQ